LIMQTYSKMGLCWKNFSYFFKDLEIIQQNNIFNRDCKNEAVFFEPIIIFIPAIAEQLHYLQQIRF